MRVVFSYECEGTCDHRHCKSDIIVTHPGASTIPLMRIPRIKDGVSRSSIAMMSEWQLLIVKKYAMEDKEVVELLHDNFSAGVSLLMESYYAENQDVIRAPFLSGSNIRVERRIDPVNLHQAVLNTDAYYLSRLLPGVSVAKYLWRSSADDIHRAPCGSVPSLFSMALKKLSISHFVFGTNFGHPYWVHTNERFDEKDYRTAYEDFNVNNVQRGPNHEYLMKLLPRALNMLYDVLGTRSSFKSLTFTYNPARLITEMRLGTSSGIRPGPLSKTELIGETRVRVGVKGPKMLQIASAVKAHIGWVKATRRLERVRIPNYNVHRLKVERRVKYGGVVADLVKLHRKKRVYFIPGLEHVANGMWLNKDRMLLERGNTFNIGRPWWHGGALQFAQHMCYNVPGIEWSSGDFAHHDKHIIDWLIMLWQCNNSVYYDFDNMSEQDRFLFVQAHGESLFNMVAKPTLHLNGVWSIIMGSLYSGGPETSPCGSWCTLFMWCLFLVHTMDNNPGLRKKMTRALLLKLIAIGIYGDDHLYCYPAIWSRLLKESVFAAFLNKYFGCIIQDAETYSSFFTTHNDFGHVLYKGPNFLKRQFIRGDETKGEPAVLPFKSTSETLGRLFAPKGPGLIDALLSAFGQAWDTMFTNRFAYDLCAKYFFELVKSYSGTSAQLFDELRQHQSNTDYESFARKLELTEVKDLFVNFPDYDQMRAQMHTIDEDVIDFSRNLQDRRAANFGDVTNF